MPIFGGVCDMDFAGGSVDHTGSTNAVGYAGFEDLYRSGDIHEIACMAHLRRKFVGLRRTRGEAIAGEAIRRIAQIYAVEKEARGRRQWGVKIRQAKARPRFEDLEVWLHDPSARHPWQVTAGRCNPRYSDAHDAAPALSRTRHPGTR